MNSDDAPLSRYAASPLKSPPGRKPEQYSLDRPMSEYFISSSHNTYLLGPQVGGTSSIDGYIVALLRGCRCVEVDCWDGGNGIPRVKHGKMFTTSVALDHVMKTINQYAFVASPYPLWISLEMHCCSTQQEVTADIIRHTFGSRLIAEPLDPSSSDLPSPEQLRERVLIKVKEMCRPGMFHMFGNLLKRQSLQMSLGAARLLHPGGLQRANSCPQKGFHHPREQVSGSASYDRCNLVGFEQQTSKRIAKSLASLGVYATSVDLFKFDGAMLGWKSNHIISLPESKIKKFVTSKSTKSRLESHSSRYMIRVYPDWHRFASTNFNPCLFWQNGIQMVALNWQTSDEGCQINDAMFAVGADRSGYVLKPPNLRGTTSIPLHISDYGEVLLDIHVISAHRIPSSLAPHKRVKARVGAEIVRTGSDRSGWPLQRAALNVRGNHTRVYTTDVFVDDRCAILNTSLKLRVETAYPDLIFLRLFLEISGVCKDLRTWYEVGTKIMKASHMRQSHYCNLPSKRQGSESASLLTILYKFEGRDAQQL